MGDPALLLLTNAGAAGLIALLAWAASRVLRRPAVVHGLWLLALVRLLAPPVAPLPLLPAWARLSPPPERPSPTAVVVPDPSRLGLLADEAGPPLPAAELRSASMSFPRSVAPRVIWGLLLVTALGIVALAGWRFGRFGRLLACARPAPPSLADRSSALAARLGLRRAPPVLLVPGRFPPMLWPAWGGPRLLLPERLAAELHGDELDTLLAHELAHVRRRDHWVRLVEIAATALFWWYPVTWWARRALRRAEERCCDEWVLRLLPDSAEAYANGLLKSLTFVSESSVPAMASGLGPVGDLEARLKEILMTHPVPRLAVPLRLALAAAAALGLAVFPTNAQSRAKTEEPTTSATTSEATIPLPAAQPAPATKPAPASRATRATGTAAIPVIPATTGHQGAEAVPVVPATSTQRSADAGDTDDEVRHAIEQHRLQLRQQQLELEQKKAQIDAEAQEAELRALADRLRTEGKAKEAAHIEKEIELNARRVELQQRQFQLEMEREAVEARLEAEARSRQDRRQEAELRAQDEATARRRQREEAEEAHRIAEDEVRRRQHALQADLVAAQEKLERAVAAEDPTRAIRAATEGLARALARQIEAFEQAASEVPARRKKLDPEIRRLKAALDALKH